MNRDDRDSQFDDLDDQIRAALHVETSSQQVERLEDFWQQQSQVDYRRRRVRLLTVVATVAATILIALTASVQLWRHPDAEKPERSRVDAKTVPAKADSEVIPEKSAGAQQKLAANGVRPATAYEQFIFTARVREREITEELAAVHNIGGLLDTLVNDPTADARELLASSNLDPATAEQLLLPRLVRSDDEQTRAMLRLLAVCGSSRSTAPVLRLCRQPSLRPQALETLERTIGVTGLATAATQSNDPRVRAAIYRRLFTNEAALDVYLKLVCNERLCDEVLAVVHDMPQPTLDALLAQLSAEDEDVRLAAAFVLGHANGPVVTRSLIALVNEDPSSHEEAWIALLACRGPQADQFLTYATSQPQLLGPFNRARVYWARMVY